MRLAVLALALVVRALLRETAAETAQADETQCSLSNALDSAPKRKRGRDVAAPVPDKAKRVRSEEIPLSRKTLGGLHLEKQPVSCLQE